MPREEQKFANMQGASQGYEARGKDFRQEIRNLKKQKRKGNLSTRETHRLDYLKKLRKRRIGVDTVKTAAEIAASVVTGGGFSAAKAGVKAGTTALKAGLKKGASKIAKKAAAEVAKKLAIKGARRLAPKVAGSIAENKMDRQIETAEGRALRAEEFGQPQVAQDIRRAGAHYTPGLESFIPIATNAAMMGLDGKFKSPEQPSMTGLDEIIGDYKGPEVSDFGLKDYDPMDGIVDIEEPEDIIDNDVVPVKAPAETQNFQGLRDKFDLWKDSRYARRRGFDPTEFTEEEGFEFPENDPAPPAPPAPPLTVDPITKMPLQTIDSGLGEPMPVQLSTGMPPQTESRSTLAELTVTEYEDLLDAINNPEDQSGLSFNISDEDLLATQQASGAGTYQDMFDQYQDNTDLSEEEIIERIRYNAEASGDIDTRREVPDAEVASSEREDFIKRNTRIGTVGITKGVSMPPRKEIVDIHMRKWEQNRPERERDARVALARQQAEALLGEYGIDFDPNEPTPDISYEKGGKLQDHMGSIEETRKYIMNKYK